MITNSHTGVIEVASHVISLDNSHDQLSGAHPETSQSEQSTVKQINQSLKINQEVKYLSQI